MIHVKSHRRGKSIVKSYSRQMRLVGVMGKIDKRLRKPARTASAMLRHGELMNLKTSVRSELNQFAKDGRNRALQIRAFRNQVLMK